MAGPSVEAGPGRILRFQPAAEPPRGAEATAGDASARRVVIADTAWTPARYEPRESVRDAADHVLSSRNLYDEAASLLADWATRSSIVDLLAIDGTSFWYRVRLGHWWWLQEQLLWLGISRWLLASERPARIECAEGLDPAAVDALRLVASAEHIPFDDETPPPVEVESAKDAEGAPAPIEAAPSRGGILGYVHRLRLRRQRRIQRERARRERELVAHRKRVHSDRVSEMLGRLDGFASQRALLVLMEHARQLVETPTETREINPYLDPILDELQAVGLAQVVVEGRANVDDEAAWRRAGRRDRSNVIFGDTLRGLDLPGEWESTAAEAAARADRIAAVRVPLIHDGIDFGPDLVERVAGHTRRAFATRLREVVRIRRLLQRLRPSGLMLANEYNRQEWLAAARAEKVPIIAVQHGGIQSRHLGYVHADRPAALTLPDRTYVFGDWERRVLVESSVYRDDEVRVSGSPRLDLVRAETGRDRNKVRSELRVARSDRLLVVSTTWGALARKYHFPVTLARLFDRPMPGIHLVIKLHPGEQDDGLYRRVIEGVAAARGFRPPPISVVHRVDLYRLLGAADAHLGIYSTVITEAVFTRTPNLLAACVQPYDLLGYVEAGVAVPVHDGAELLALMEDPHSLIDDDKRNAFVRDHFEAGNASRRIRDELVAWLRPGADEPDRQVSS
jgi:hypothetical protein